MGGNALRQPSCRLNKQELLELIVKFNSEIGEQVKSPSPGVNVFQPIPFYTSKDSFGNLDIAVMCSRKDWARLLDELKQYPDWSKNGNVFSFGMDVGKETDFQIDLIYVGETRNELTAAITYFSFNDLGNLMGRIAHRAGFKYGHRGLLRVVREEDNSDHILGEVLVTDVPKDIFEFLGYDYDVFLNGFNDKKDIFEFVASSPYFNVDIFLFENRNAKARTRDSKRTIYNEFLVWCSEQKNLTKFFTGDKEEFRREQLKLALDRFPEFNARYVSVVRATEERTRERELFNGDIVKKLTGLTGKDLGVFIRNFREKFPSISSMTKETIEENIKEFANAQQHAN